MSNLKRYLSKILCLPLLTLPVLLLAEPGYADSNTRIHGGIAIDTGNLRLYISDHHVGSYLLNRYDDDYRTNHQRRDHYYRENNHQRDQHHSRGYQSRAYANAYIHNYYIRPNYRHQLSRDAYRITRDYRGDERRHERWHERHYERTYHQRSHHD
ncbi:hypothetical protein [Amphritea sp.]|uniref:hypothetical protein n=1 Tax=Amphritea sp. TaxID=1872502 RepID=UPI003D10343C